MKKNLEHKSYHISIVIAVVYGRFVVVCGRFCGRLGRKGVVWGRGVDFGGRRMIKKKIHNLINNNKQIITKIKIQILQKKTKDKK